LAIIYQPKAEYYYYRGAAYYELGKRNDACNDLKKAMDSGFEEAKKDYGRLCF